MQAAAASASAAAATVRGGVSRAVASMGGAVVAFVAVALVALVAITLYIVVRVRRSDLESVRVIKRPRSLSQHGASPFVFDKLPALTNGQEYCISFWLYLAEFEHTSGDKLIVRRAGGASELGSPVVYLDRGTNALRVALLTSHGAPLGDAAAELAGLHAAGHLRHLVATVDYVPLQRWVNYAVVVQDGLLSVYQDGDLYTVENVRDLEAPGDALSRPVLAPSRGALYVGATDWAPTRVRGFLSGMRFYNHAPSQADVRAQYARGPASVAGNMLARIGIPEYGLRSPLYRVGEEGEGEEEEEGGGGSG